MEQTLLLVAVQPCDIQRAVLEQRAPLWLQTQVVVLLLQPPEVSVEADRPLPS